MNGRKRSIVFTKLLQTIYIQTNDNSSLSLIRLVERTSTRRKKAWARRSRETDGFSNLENMDVLLVPSEFNQREKEIIDKLSEINQVRGATGFGLYDKEILNHGLNNIDPKFKPLLVII